MFQYRMADDKGKEAARPGEEPQGAVGGSKDTEPPQDYDPLADSINGELPSSPLSSSDSVVNKRQRMNTPSPKPYPQPGTSPQASPFLVPGKLFVTVESI